MRLHWRDVRCGHQVPPIYWFRGLPQGAVYGNRDTRVLDAVPARRLLTSDVAADLPPNLGSQQATGHGPDGGRHPALARAKSRAVPSGPNKGSGFRELLARKNSGRSLLRATM